MSVLVNNSAYAKQPSSKKCYFFNSVSGDFDFSDDKVRTIKFFLGIALVSWVHWICCENMNAKVYRLTNTDLRLL